MGDAGVPPNELAQLSQSGQDGIRDIHVLVTGFGPFNTFSTNPSWLIASALPTILEALQDQPPPIQQTQSTQPSRNPLAALLIPQPQPPALPLRPPNSTPYRIRIHTYPSPIRVAYDSTATLIPSLLSPQTNLEHIDYDYVLHIGLASGRDSYTLETQGHRDHYIIPDIDGIPGYAAGEKIWRSLGVPDRLDVGWESSDVLRRWVSEVDRQQPEQQPTPDAQSQRFASTHGILGLRSGPRPPVSRKAVVKLSRDAGRFLCEFILMASLAWRWREGVSQPDDEIAREKIGKVAFLHVPNGIDAADVTKGVMVAESAIRALVASWEAGYRNPLVYAPLPDAVINSTAEKQKSLVAAEGSFETAGTGDAMPTAS